VAAYLKVFGNLDFRVVARTKQCMGLLQIRLAERLGPLAHTSPAARSFETGIDPLPQYVALKLRERGKEVKGQQLRSERRTPA
jgi:hypothetical protein